ncbi:hypothetical protein [Nonomuraea turcica]|nr:hypothetical protein [Nonomuraea sp. G32]MDP4510155.1 hypothetical protein [Nonomuraea sp. G32]
MTVFYEYEVVEGVLGERLHERQTQALINLLRELADLHVGHAAVEA